MLVDLGAISRPEATHGSWADPFQISVRAEVPWAKAPETKSHSGLITNPLRLRAGVGRKGTAGFSVLQLNC